MEWEPYVAVTSGIGNTHIKNCRIWVKPRWASFPLAFPAWYHVVFVVRPTPVVVFALLTSKHSRTRDHRPILYDQTASARVRGWLQPAFPDLRWQLTLAPTEKEENDTFLVALCRPFRTTLNMQNLMVWAYSACYICIDPLCVPVNDKWGNESACCNPSLTALSSSRSCIEWLGGSGILVPG